MARYTITPNEGLESIRFGETRASLHARLGAFESFHRADEGSATDHFIAEGLLLSFDDKDLLEFIEVTPQARVEYRGIELFGSPYDVVRARLEELGIEGVENDQGVDYMHLGFSLFTPFPEVSGEEAHGVSIFPEGYYS